MPLLAPLLAGGSSRDRILAGLGAGSGIALTAMACLNLPLAGSLPMLVAPVGASAVLVFAVPASPLAQPWPVIGGNCVSAVLGVAIGQLVPWMPLAGGLAVLLAILAMSILRCLHPPGGAAALTAVLAGPAVQASGFAFPLVPVAANSIALILAGLLFHRLSGHAYPHRPAPALPVAPPVHDITEEDIDRALADLDETFDIAREDLARIAGRAVLHARRR
jgi:CBS domain-containing membrane protein